MQGTGRRQGTGVTIMYKGQKVTVVMPAYNAEKTLRRSFEEVCEQDVADVVVIVDDCSNDGTEQVAREICNYQLPTTNYPLPSTIATTGTWAMVGTKRAATVLRLIMVRTSL